MAEEILLRERRSGRLHKGHVLPGGFLEPLEGEELGERVELEQVDALPPDPPVESLCRSCFFDQDKPTLNTRGDAP